MIGKAILTYHISYFLSVHFIEPATAIKAKAYDQLVTIRFDIVKGSRQRKTNRHEIPLYLFLR